jgi:hypothetical protein
MAIRLVRPIFIYLLEYFCLLLNITVPVSMYRSEQPHAAVIFQICVLQISDSDIDRRYQLSFVKLFLLLLCLCRPMPGCRVDWNRPRSPLTCICTYRALLGDVSVPGKCRVRQKSAYWGPFLLGFVLKGEVMSLNSNFQMVDLNVLVLILS